MKLIQNHRWQAGCGADLPRQLPLTPGPVCRWGGVAGWLLAVVWLALGAPMAEAQLTIGSILPAAVTNTPGTVATFNVNYSWPNLTLSATGAVLTITVPSPIQNSAAGNLVLVNNPQVTNSFYSTTNQTIYFQFVSPLPAGSAGSVQFQAYLRTDGTVTNGSKATFQATFSALGQPAATNSASLSASGVSDNASLSQTLLGKGTITTNSLITYQISPRNANPSLNITNWTMVDLLPSNTVYVSSSPTGVYSASLGTITWTSNSFAVGNSPTYLVQLYAPNPPFVVGNSISNRVWTTNVFLDGNTVVKGVTNSTAITAPNVTFDSVAKSSASWNGQFNAPFTWSTGWRARGNDTATTLTVTDLLPASFVPTAINPSYPDLSTTVYIQYQTRNNPSWTSLPGSPFTPVSPTDANNKVYYLTNLHLVSDLVTGVQWIYTNVSPLATFNSSDVKPTITGVITNLDRDGVTVGPTNSITNFVTLAASYRGTNVVVGTTSNSVTLAVAAPLVQVLESISAGNPGQPGTTNTWGMEVYNTPTASDNLTNPVLATLLPLSLQYVTGSASGAGGNLTLTNTVVTTNYNGTGRTLLKLQYSGYLKPGNSATTSLKTRINSGVVPQVIPNGLSLVGWANASINSSSPLAADTNNLSGLGNPSLTFPTISANLTVTTAAAASSVKRVKGQLDSAYVGYPQYGSSYPGGPFSYQETISNPGNLPLTNITVVDILPFVGDLGVLSTNQARASAWQPFLTGPVSGPSGVSVYYSTSTNPYRPEILGTNTPGSPADWTTVVPSDLTTVRALKFAFGPTNILNPLDALQLTWSLQVPAGAPTNSFAYNSFAYTGTPATTNSSAFISEPNKVGILALPLQPCFLGSLVWNDYDQNGIFNTGEQGMNGVRVELYAAGPSKTPGAADNTFLQFVLTAPGPTGNAGYYQFPYLAPSNYFLKVIAPANYAFSPQYQGANTNLYSSFNPASGWSGLITLTPGATNENVNCAVYYTANGTIGDYVWIDRNGNGVQDEGSIDGLNGVAVKLYSVTGTTTNLYSTTATGFDSFGNPGYYHFFNVPPGQYQLRFVPPTGDTFTLFEANGANSGNGSEANAAGWTSVFLLHGGDVNNTFDAGIILPSGPLSVGRMVWYDPNADGRYDFFGGERGFNNVIVSLYWDTDNNGAFTPGTDQLFSSTVTTTLGGEPGNYSFNNLPAGNFIVVLEPLNFQPGGVLYGLTNDPTWVSVAPGYVDNVNKGEPIGAYVASTAFPLAAGTEPTTPNSNLTVDFGLTYLTNLCSAGSTVFLDSNQNGKQDTGEPGLAGVGVQLWRVGPSGLVAGSDAALVASTNTDANGTYIFAYLPPTNYFIEIPAPPATAKAVSPVVYTGNQQEVYNHGVQPGGYNTAVYGPVFTLSPGGEPTNIVTVLPGGTLDAGLPGGAANGDMTEDFGFFDSSGMVAIGNTVFNDLNANGVQDAGEPGLAGIGLALARIVGGVSNVVAYTTSDTNGHYKFDLLVAGTYQVVVLATNFGSAGVLTNWLSSPGALTGAPTNQYVNDHGIDDPRYAINGIHSAIYDLGVGTGFSAGTNATPVEVPAANANQTIDFGFTPTYSLGNRVFADNGAGGGTMNNGIQDGAEPGLSNVVVKLFGADINGRPSGTALGTNTTDALGYYRFDGLLAGMYVVVVDPAASGTALGGLVSSAGWDTGLTAADAQMDHGIDAALGAGSVLPGGIASIPVTLGAGLEPAGELDLGSGSTPPRGHGPSGDANDNLVIDFGFAPAYSVSQAVVAVSQPAAGAGGTQVTPGGLVTYGLVVGVPEGSLSGLTLVDQIPAGMQYVSSQLITTAAASSNLLTANFAGTVPAPVVAGGSGNGSPVTWTFGAISAPGIVPTNTQYFAVMVTLQALDVAGNVGVGSPTILGNAVNCTANGQPAFAANAVAVTVVEPFLALAEGISPLTSDPEGSVTVTLTVANTGTSAAYGVTVQDLLNAANFDLGSVALGTAGLNYPPSFTPSYSGLTGMVQYNGGTVAANSAAVFTFTVKLAAAVAPGSVLTNSSVLLSSTTLPGSGGRQESGGSALATVGVYTRSLGGTVYADTNNNGVKDTGEAGLAGVSLTLTGTDATGHAVSLSTNTAADGSYSFPSLAPGLYTLTRASTPSGYADGKETAGSTFGGVVNNNAASATISGVSIPGGSGTSGTGYNFGLIQPNSLAGLVFSDQNNDGIMNGQDFGISNVVMTLTGTCDWGTVSATNVTANDGTYSFGGLRPGTYTIAETQPAAFGQGRNLVGSLGGVNSTADMFTGIAASQNQNGTGYNFAELPGVLAGVVFNDQNYSHTPDAGEGIGGVKVTLSGTNVLGQGVSLTNTTGAGGAYGFSNLLAGTYTATVVTNTLAGGMLADVDPDGVLDNATTASLSGGAVLASENFGYYQLVLIGDWVWHDANANGVQDAGETGLAGVGVYLAGADGSGNAISTQTNTDSNGHYSFSVPPGIYTLTVGTPAGFVPTLTGQGGAGLGSHPSPSGTTPAFLVGGSIDLAMDFGFYQPVAMGAYVWNDLNGDGIQNDAPAGLARVGLSLLGTNAAGVVVIGHTATDATGHYGFNEPPGTYTVSVDPTNFNTGGPLGGFVATVAGLGTAATGSKISPASAALAEGGTDQTLNFGYYKPVVIGDYVWNDANANGIQDSGEIGMSNVVLTLKGTNGAGQSVNATTNSDATGHYYFSVPPGTYTVGAAIPNGFVPTLTGQGTVGTGSNPNPTGTIPVFLAGGGSDLVLDFGFYQPVAIGTYVWNDLNENGIQDDGAAGLASVGLTLVGTNAAGVVVNGHTLTDQTGHYAFSEPPGAYSVSVDPTNFIMGGPLTGLVPTVAGQGTGATGSRSSPATTSLSEGGSDLTLSFGFHAPDAYRTQADGNWSNPAIWQRWNGVQWVNATVPPNYTNGLIQIMATNTVALTASVSADQLEVDGALTIQPGVALSIVSNTFPGLQIYGALTNLGTLSLDPNNQAFVNVSGTLVNAAVVNSTSSDLVFSGGTYIHAFTTNAGVIPAATWQSYTNHEATCEVAGYTTDSLAPAGLNQNFLNFIWNCPAQAGGINLSTGIGGLDNFTVAATGTGKLTLGANLVVTNQITVSGGAELDCGQTVLAGGSFTLAAGATLGLGAPEGISASGATGNLRTPNNSFSTAANYVFNGSLPQTAGSGLPSVVNNLTINNSQGTVSLVQATSVSGTLALATGANLLLPPGTTSTASYFVVAATPKASGSWGASISAAQHQSDVYFALSTGLLNVSAGAPAAFGGLVPTSVIAYGTSNLTLSGTVTGPNASHPVDGETITVTIDGLVQTATISGGAGSFSLSFPSATLQHNNSLPHAIAFAYGGDSNLNAATDASTSVQVQAVPATIRAGNDQKTYGAARAYGSGSTNFSVTGLVNGENVVSVTITATGGTNANDAVGSYGLIPSLPAGGTANPGNYTLSFNNGSLVVGKLPVLPVVTLNPRVYDRTTTATTIATRGLSAVVGADDVSLGTSGTVASFPSRNVGAYSLVVNALALSGTTAGNYLLSTNTVVVSGAITPRPITLTAGTNLKVYDGTTSATNIPAITLGSLALGDTAAFHVTYDTPAAGTGKTLTPAGTANDGNQGSNYLCSFVASTGGVINQASPALKLFSSSLTNGYLAGVFFTATNLPADATSNVVFSANGVAFYTNSVTNGWTASLPISFLPRGNTNLILAAYTGDNNYVAAQASLIEVITNHPPIAAPVFYTRTAGTLLRIFWSNLQTNWSDLDGDSITSAGFNLTSTNHVTVATNSLQILYPNTAPNVNDQLTYVIRDSWGTTNLAVINIVVNPFVTGQQMALSPTNFGSITYFGHPGYTYVLQRSINLSNPNGWVNISTNTIGAGGQVTVADKFKDLSGRVPSSAYYRVGWAPAY